MPWNGTFIQRLHEGTRLSFRLATLPSMVSLADGRTFVEPGEWRGIVSVQVDPATVQPVTWQCSSGAWSVTLSGVEGYREALQTLTRGSLVALYASADGIEECIAIGVVRAISSRRLPLWTLEAWDLPSALMTRITTTPSRTALAYDTGESGHTYGGATTTYSSGLGTATVTVAATTGFNASGLFVIGGAYYSYTGLGGGGTTFTGCSTAPIYGTAPDASSGDTVAEVTGGATTYVSGIGTATITVGSTAGFSRKTGGNGLLKIGDAYYTYTGTGGGGTTFTGCSTTPLIGTAPTPAAGDVVLTCAYWYGHPMAIARGVIVSAGGGSADDDYPAAWGFGLHSSYLDNVDIDRWMTYVVKVSSGSYTWELVADAPVESPMSWLLDHLADAGMWLCVRQGLLTIRAAQAPVASSTVYLSGEHITDAEIRAVPEIEHFDPARSDTFAKVVCRAESVEATQTATPGTIPCSAEIVYDVGDKVLGNRGRVCAEMLARLANWPPRLNELVRVTVGLDRAHLCPGDLVLLSTEHLVSRYSAASGTTIAEQVVMVLSVAPDWMQGYCRLELAILPSWDGVFP